MNRKERRRLKKQGVRVAAADTLSILRQAALHHRLGRFADAEAMYRRALAGDPNNPDALHLLGLTRREQGATGEAVDLIRRAIDACDGGNALYFKSLVATLLVANQPGEAEAAARRALAFEANAARRDGLRARGQEFDAKDHDAFVARIIEVFDRSFIDDLAGAGLPSEVPVFVVGMPRSGTTLVEHIATSHPDVHGAGELTAFAGLRDGLAAAVGAPEGEAFPDCARHLDGTTVREIAEAHLALLAEIGGGAARVIDKSPLNVFTLGLAAVLLPNVRIVGLLKKSGGCGSLLRYVVFDLRKLRDVGAEEPGSVGIVRRGLA